MLGFEVKHIGINTENAEEAIKAAKLFELSSGIVNDMDIMSVAKPHLDKLSRHTGEAVHLVIDVYKRQSL